MTIPRFHAKRSIEILIQRVQMCYKYDFRPEQIAAAERELTIVAGEPIKFAFRGQHSTGRAKDILNMIDRARLQAYEELYLAGRCLQCGLAMAENWPPPLEMSGHEWAAQFKASGWTIAQEQKNAIKTRLENVSDSGLHSGFLCPAHVWKGIPDDQRS